MSIDFQRIRDIFQSVAELPASERAVVLDRECAGDTELRRRVDALLKAHDDSGELPAVEPLSTKSQSQQEIPADELDQTIGYVQPIEPGLVFAGRYKLREKLGEGGMGVVFVADQIAPVQRRVALKVIRSGLDTRQLLARFEQERQALALMDHPNIAKVFDAGIDEAHRPYFAMELVKGLPLTKYCDEARLSPRQRIELFIPVCQAVQHAHQKGIIHRDLKPSNILVGLYDGRPVPKVIDFGVAKVTGTRLTDQSVYTEIGSIIGTLEYMSPEQAELNNLDIDTRSDVYALGVILYELLTGTVPFSRKELEKAGLAEMLRVIKEEEPHKPSTKLSSSVKLPSIAASRQTEPKKLTALVRGELDWIVMKALEKDRGRRYETANGLGQDVQRYLTGEPVMAAPASTAYRLRKLIRRNKGPVIAGSLVFAALLIGMAGTTWGLFRADHQRQIAEQNADKALASAKAEKEAKELANSLFSLSKESVEKYLVTVTDEPELKQADFHRLRKKLLESALPFFEQITGLTSDNPNSKDLEELRGRAYHRLAMVRAEMGENEAAIQDYESVRVVFAQLNAEFPSVQRYRHYFATSQNNLGLLLENFGRRAEAESALRRALGIQEKLTADFPTVPEYRRDLAGSHNNLGNLFRKMGTLAEAEASFRQAVGIQEKLATDFNNVPEYDDDLSLSKSNLGNLLRDMGKAVEAESTYRQAIGIQEKLAADFPSLPGYRKHLAMTRNSLGNLLLNQGMQTESEANFRQALEIQQNLAADFPNVPEYRSDLAGGHHNLGTLLAHQRKYVEATVAFRAALDIWIRLVTDFPSVPDYRNNLVMSHNAFGMALMEQGEFTDANVEFRKGLEIQEKLTIEFPKESAFRFELAASYRNLGVMLNRQEKLADAELLYCKALEIYEKLATDFPTVPIHRRELAMSQNNLGSLLEKKQHRSRESEVAYVKAIEIREKLATDFPTVPEYRSDLASSYKALGERLAGHGKYADAEVAFRKAITIWEQLSKRFPTAPDYRGDLAGSHNSMAALLQAGLGKHIEAKTGYRRALEIQEELVREFPNVPKYRKDLAGIYNNMGALQIGLMEYAEADMALHRAAEIHQMLVTDFPSVPEYWADLAKSYHNLGVLMASLGKRADAVAAHQSAISIQKKTCANAPTVDEYVVDLGRSYFSLGLVLQGDGDADSALGSYDVVISTLTPFLSQEPTPASVRQILSVGHWGRAGSLVALGRHAESINDWERALELDDGTSKDAIRLGAAQTRLRMQQKNKDAARCIAAASQFESLGRTDVDGLFNAAYFRAVCASVVLEDPNTPAADANRLAKEQADLAMAWLHKAVEAGYDNVEHMKTDADLNALRERDDFKKLLEDLTKAMESKKE